MEKKTKKGKTAKSSGNNLFSFHINENEVIDRTDFGSFEVVRTKRGIMFRTYTGYHIWTSPYAVGVDGTPHYNSLYSWLDNLVEMSKAYSGHENEIFDKDIPDVTTGDILESQKIMTVANLTMPLTIFVDPDKAADAANSYMKWLDDMQKKFLSTMSGGIPDDIDEAEYAIERTKAEVADTLESMKGELGDI